MSPTKNLDIFGTSGHHLRFSASDPDRRAATAVSSAQFERPEMHDRMFFTPVAVTVGAGHKRMLASLSEMHEFLTEFPPSRRYITVFNLSAS